MPAVGSARGNIVREIALTGAAAALRLISVCAQQNVCETERECESVIECMCVRVRACAWEFGCVAVPLRSV
eukprot:1468274-Rhodomonas_salina.1